MLRKEFTTHHTLQRISDAVNAIVAVHKNDYKLEQSGTGAIMLLCRTGYSWGTIAEFMWEGNTESQLEMMIECRPNPDVFLTHQLQKEYEEKYMENLFKLFTAYTDKLPVVRKELNTYKISFKKRLGFILSTAFITVLVILVIINSVE
jgi:hypothetical protein